MNTDTLEQFIEKIKSTNYYSPPHPCDEGAVHYASKDTEHLTLPRFIPTMSEDLKKTYFKIYNNNDVLAAQILSIIAINGSKSVKHCISNISLDSKTGDTVIELIDFQKDIFKEYDNICKVRRV